MKVITFIDTEIEPNSGKILDIGSIKVDGSSFHSNSVSEFKKFIQGSQYVCGHNILYHDLKYIKNTIIEEDLEDLNFIDTLYLSPLLFPTKPYHALLKDDKLQTEDTNNPLNDSIKARDLFFDEVTAFHQMDKLLKKIYYSLLKDKKEFGSFFHFLEYNENTIDIENMIREKFNSQICEEANLLEIITEYPIELAYSLGLINTKSRYSITPPWVLKNFPAVEKVMFLLRSNPCLRGCSYCDQALDIHKGLKRFFGFDSYRTYGGEPLQEKAVKAAISNKSLLAVFPTGGGKSITFQVPALMSGRNLKGLTVVISPLQSLMKDQVDNLEKAGITEAVTINGLLDPIERAKSFERVENGSASILYISPESLRSKTIERILLGRNVVRFVIDEAHCFSSWGQDFRVDYLYIGDFIKTLQERKNMEEGIPVSCFTATAKQKVIEDIREYFKEKLSLDMEIFSSNASRSNLRYKVFQKESEEEKYNTVRDLIEEKNCPTIVYVSRTRKAYSLAQRLVQDGYQAKPYHGKMDKQEKSENQDAFIRGEVQIMVATSAFGMGVDKKDVGMVIHYEISDSLENYIQEAGRAGRDESVSADCFVLFNDEDLSKHFILLNQTKLSIQEIQQVWKAIKDITRFRSRVSQSALEIARKAGWDDNIKEIETRVTTAIAALEDSGYLKRGQNMPRIYANSILSKNAMEAIAKINNSGRFTEKQKMNATRIIKKLFSSKSRRHTTDEDGEARIDYISDYLGIVKEEVIQIISLLREEKILADTKDLSAFIKRKESKNRSLAILKSFRSLEGFLLTILENEEKILHIKELNEQAERSGFNDVTPNRIKTVFNFWAIKNWIKRQTVEYSKNHIAVLSLQSKEWFEEKLTKRYELAQFIVEYLYDKSITSAATEELNRDEILVEFSILELKEEFEGRLLLFNTKVTVDDIEDALFYLSKIEALKIEGGFMVVYNALTIERLEKDNKKRYKIEDYQKLNQFYQNKVQQIHIVGEYARKMISDYKAALQFVDDYFHLNYISFLNKYFNGSQQNDIRRNITPAKFKQLFGELSPTQLKIINDNESRYIVVAAGPGSGKTRILVHKLASLLLMEDVKHEQLLMVTFSRSAATEFKIRLLKLIGNAANFIEIKTFHSYCFDLLGRVGTLEKSEEVIQETIRRIKSGDVEAGRITKTVLVIDEAQDMDANEFELISALMEYNEEMRVIAVGDDDQNIYEFRGASSKYLKILINEKNAMLYELVENHRSKSNLVHFSNQFVKRIPNRLKNTPIIAVQKDMGKIKLVKYRSCNLITPLVNNILREGLVGSTCVLTKMNEEALHIAGLLVKNGIQAKLIQSNDGFNLYNLLEVRFFLSQLNLYDDIYMISDDVWAGAKRRLIEQFPNNPNLETCVNLIKDFEAVNPRNKYKSDLEIFIRESKLEDFFSENMEKIFVSTIHKAKGREFDNVFLMLDRFNIGTDEAVRQLYVAMTRAKRNLTVHYNGNYLDSIKAEGLHIIEDFGEYQPPGQFAMQLTFRDVWLDFFMSCQNLISELNSGDILAVDEDCCRNSRGQAVLRFSKQFINQIKSIKQKNYLPKAAKIRFIIYWKKETLDCEIRIILPELYFEREEDL
ncbi:RecQ family ATP-dependent DNA helicase [Clostridium sp. BNL1100]|uniref:RecQ family ATP-dependent DNA helicase n=1 Tax=Clostridium sp. BNL1100 TaxID=755731 RepID=UPI00024A7A14|nr:RecQ family ATP-dependent DNA helicase [Clostridium sp. BNL1100]AEY64880.1 ATP-dependent DNA helicase, RecQ family [Clostridium sp. BNL1100]